MQHDDREQSVLSEVCPAMNIDITRQAKIEADSTSDGNRDSSEVSISIGNL